MDTSPRHLRPTANPTEKKNRARLAAVEAVGEFLRHFAPFSLETNDPPVDPSEYEIEEEDLYDHPFIAEREDGSIVAEADSADAIRYYADHALRNGEEDGPLYIRPRHSGAIGERRWTDKLEKAVLDTTGRKTVYSYFDTSRLT